MGRCEVKGLDGNLRGYEPGWLMHGVKRLARLACVAVRTTMGAYKGLTGEALLCTRARGAGSHRSRGTCSHVVELIVERGF